MKPNKQLEIKKRAIYNATLDPKLVKQLSKLSNDQLLINYGIRVPKRLPKVKTFASSLQKSLRRQKYLDQLEKYQYAKQKGFTPEEARRIKRRKRVEIDKLMEGQRLLREAIGGMTSKEQRMRQWATWTNKEGKGYQFPKEYEFLAKEINRRTIFEGKRLKKNHGLGYAAVYFAFINNSDINTEWAKLSVDRAQPDYYRIKM